nr:MAG TPA: hypothetical protein [Caudoviricetes sp.]
MRLLSLYTDHAKTHNKIITNRSALSIIYSTHPSSQLP